MSFDGIIPFIIYLQSMPNHPGGERRVDFTTPSPHTPGLLGVKRIKDNNIFLLKINFFFRVLSF